MYISYLKNVVCIVLWCIYLFHSVQVVTVCVQAVAALREQSSSDQPAEGEQQVRHTEQDQRLQLQTHKTPTQRCFRLSCYRRKNAHVNFTGFIILYTPQLIPSGFTLFHGAPEMTRWEFFLLKFFCLRSLKLSFVATQKLLRKTLKQHHDFSRIIWYQWD